MNIVTKEAKKKQAVVEFAYKKGKSAASENKRYFPLQRYLSSASKSE